MRYTAEWRGGSERDKPWEWCVIDEEIRPCGFMIAWDLTEEQARGMAKKLNEEENKKNDK